MAQPIPDQLQAARYISLTTYRKTGVGVATPVWFGVRDGKMYVFSNPKAGKLKRIRNNPRVTLAPCTIRGRVTGPEFLAAARILPREEWASARRVLEQKYWLMRVPFLWSKDSVLVEVELT
jgi:hypothetical protein